MTAFSISFAMFALRFFLYPLWVLSVELLNGITFGLSYIAGISYSAKIAPNGSSNGIPRIRFVVGLIFYRFRSISGSSLHWFSSRRRSVGLNTRWLYIQSSGQCNSFQADRRYRSRDVYRSNNCYSLYETERECNRINR